MHAQEGFNRWSRAKSMNRARDQDKVMAKTDSVLQPEPSELEHELVAAESAGELDADLDGDCGTGSGLRRIEVAAPTRLCRPDRRSGARDHMGAAGTRRWFISW
jgi:hypothetical protein